MTHTEIQSSLQLPLGGTVLAKFFGFFNTFLAFVPPTQTHLAVCFHNVLICACKQLPHIQQAHLWFIGLCSLIHNVDWPPLIFFFPAWYHRNDELTRVTKRVASAVGASFFAKSASKWLDINDLVLACSWWPSYVSPQMEKMVGPGHGNIVSLT